MLETATLKPEILAPAQRVARLRNAFESGLTRDVASRKRQLAAIDRFLRECEPEIARALHDDLGRPAFEAYASEIAFTKSEIAFATKHLARWTRPERVPTPLLAQPGRSFILREPRGVVLIIGPWNYPLQLLLAPLVGAIAAGCCAVLKPSEIAPATSELLCSRLGDYVDPDWVQIVAGGAVETTALLALPFDHILYTGGAAVGRVVMEAAAQRLTPVTLELGGKSPCLVDRSANLQVAARRILWGKTYNAGQTCVAPDHVLVHEAVIEPLLEQLKQAIHHFFGPDPSKSPDYGRIVSVKHHRRLAHLLDGAGTVVTGGDHDETSRYFAPTILRDVPESAAIQHEEIFGPILPVIATADLDVAIARVNHRPRPLALYLFTSDAQVERAVLDRTSSGGVLVNHTLLHLAVPGLPFGGVGASGFGAYHGRASFETFSHPKSVLKKPTWFDPDVFYPPYTAAKTRIGRWFM